MGKACSKCSAGVAGRKHSKKRRRISGTRFRASGKNGIMENAFRGFSAGTGLLAGEATTNKLLGKYKAKNQALIGGGKVLLSHVVLPWILPDKIAHNQYVEAGLDGWGASGLKDVIVGVAGDVASKAGITGTPDYGYFRNRTTTDTVGNKVSVDLQ